MDALYAYVYAEDIEGTLEEEFKFLDRLFGKEKSKNNESYNREILCKRAKKEANK